MKSLNRHGATKLPSKEPSGKFVALITIALFAVGIMLAVAGGAAGRLGSARPSSIDSNGPVESRVDPAASNAISETENGDVESDREIIRPGVRDDSDDGNKSSDDGSSDMMLIGGREVCCLQGNISPMDRVRDEG
jgi:hypothetical protein